MVRIHALVALTATLAIALEVTGCGQKGPLVLPDAQRPHKRVVMPRSGAAGPAATSDPATATGTAVTSPPAPSTPDTAAPTP